jgi:hypothetical protein
MNTHKLILSLAMMLTMTSVVACKKDTVNEDTTPKETSTKPADSPAETTPPVEPDVPAANTSIEGGYAWNHIIEVFDGEDATNDEEVTDCLALKRDGEDLSFAFELVQTNAHTCSMNGLAKASGENRWVYEERNEEDGFICVLEIVVTDTAIELKDSEDCRSYYCGARGYIDGASFERATQRADDFSCMESNN